MQKLIDWLARLFKSNTRNFLRLKLSGLLTTATASIKCTEVTNGHNKSINADQTKACMNYSRLNRFSLKSKTYLKFIIQIQSQDLLFWVGLNHWG